jgi:hypothetical protein
VKVFGNFGDRIHSSKCYASHEAEFLDSFIQDHDVVTDAVIVMFTAATANLPDSCFAC